MILHINTTPENCYRKIITRGREEECSITMDYLKDLHTLHDNWLHDKSLTLAPVWSIHNDDDTEILDEELTALDLKLNSLFNSTL